MTKRPPPEPYSHAPKRPTPIPDTSISFLELIHPDTAAPLTLERASAHYALQFKTIASKLLSGTCILHITAPNAERIHRFIPCEVEFYIKSKHHPDPYTHVSAAQSQFGLWRFHKRGNSYAGGTWKGMDISLGSNLSDDGAAPSDAVYGGILLRSMVNLDSRRVVEGPCKIVDAILDIVGAQNVADLATRVLMHDLRIDNVKSSIYISNAETDMELSPGILESPRIGLYLRKAHKEDLRDRRYFVSQLYRFHSQDVKLVKGKAHTLVGLFLNRQATRESIEEIVMFTGHKKSFVEVCFASFQAGRKMSYTEFVLLKVINSASNLCKYFGAIYGDTWKSLEAR
ncbi:hypothetical protein SeMB42_g04012 [Synchytrium endobioticum]|uniref:Uncharacterized protein n=1 Tax=Synchytrium endobioticum TaxID=286115 RepID=A0A507D280_9FUNG|nr:hypothetical protein SeLEV6574_g06051 [Synchytrium endobioticum]TPX45405.1 hypothetical protein SeMB42_g04012 [Synchytrium endobioticum]